MLYRKILYFSISVTIVLVLACGFGGGEPEDNDDTGPTSLSFPMDDGTSWTYKCEETAPETSYTLVKTISGSVIIPHDTIGYTQPEYPETLTWVRQYDRDSTFYLNDGEYIWFGQMDSTLGSFGLNPFVPFRVVKLDYEIGDTFSTLIHKGSGFLTADITFSAIIDNHEDVTVPAGFFQDCLKIDATLLVISMLGEDTVFSTIWFADEIGQIKRWDYYESGSNHTYIEELADYDI
ncbi:hypothetical protein DRQ36_03290 [bacterium]|nr:MAG: hypothetical protein DRQ36_03290 [bacterium]